MAETARVESSQQHDKISNGKDSSRCCDPTNSDFKDPHDTVASRAKHERCIKGNSDKSKCRVDSTTPVINEHRGPLPYLPFSSPPHLFGAPDPRNAVFEPYLGYAVPYPVPYPMPYLHAPMPLTPNTNEGRYLWPHSPLTFHHPRHGVTASPACSDMSSVSMQRSPQHGEPLANFASRIQWEQLQRSAMHCSPLSGMKQRGISPEGFGNFISPYPPPHPPSVPLSHRSIFSEHPATPSGSITLPGSLESSRLTSPHPSILGKGSRKRALSHSPFSECGLDIESLTRSSEGSLQLQFGLPGHSRSSSASGSYGHLSAASLGAMSPSAAMTPSGGHPLFRHGHGTGSSLSGSPYFPGVLPPGMLAAAVAARQAPMTSTSNKDETSHQPPSAGPTNNVRKDSNESGCGSNVVSSTVDCSAESKMPRMIKEEYSPSSVSTFEGCHGSPIGEDSKHGEQPKKTEAMSMVEGEPDFVETNCHWTDCNSHFDTQDDLVRHLNIEHVQSNKKVFTCRWKDCSRQEKPFKAQYMLVVHMRRHTGEKPHRCTFEGCYKAYSRLENLKTHLRSHTGEKPYMCEFPGCTKAFSNASDRAKHQNRTHSNAKPYICKVPGCTKRYTDPSSLRKHVKTVHGAEAYANKRYKGDSYCSDSGSAVTDMHSEYNTEISSVQGAAKVESPINVKEEEEATEGKVESCLQVTSLATTSGGHDKNDSKESSALRRPKRTNSGNQQLSPVNNDTTRRNVLSPEMTNHKTSGQRKANSMTGSGGVGGSLASEVETEEDEIMLPGGPVISGTSTTAVQRSNRVDHRLRHIMNKKKAVDDSTTLPTLPPIGNSRRVGSNRQETTSESKLSKNSQHKRICDIISQNAKDSSHGLNVRDVRRDSNSSSISSYMSSILSDASPYPGGLSNLSSRRSSEASSASANHSIANSPYEYDYTSNVPGLMRSRRPSETSSIGNMTDQLSRTKLGSNSNLIVNSSQGSNQSLRSPTTRSNREPVNRYLNSSGESTNLQPHTPIHTPLPHEIPGREIRRTSDPVRGGRFSLPNDQLQLQRHNSTGNMKPLPVPPPGRGTLHRRTHSNTSNFYSSRSSIATDPTSELAMGDTDDNLVNSSIDPSLLESTALETTIDESIMEENLLEDSNLIYIPDEMREFLHETYKQTIKRQEAGGNMPDGVDQTHLSAARKNRIQQPQQQRHMQSNQAADPKQAQPQQHIHPQHQQMYMQQQQQHAHQNLHVAPQFPNAPTDQGGYPNLMANQCDGSAALQAQSMSNIQQQQGNMNFAGNDMNNHMNPNMHMQGNQMMGGMPMGAGNMPNMVQQQQMQQQQLQQQQQQAMYNANQWAHQQQQYHQQTGPYPHNFYQQFHNQRGAHQSMLPHPPNSPAAKQANSPMVQVPEIGQSQIPPHANSANAMKMAQCDAQMMPPPSAPLSHPQQHNNPFPSHNGFMPEQFHPTGYPHNNMAANFANNQQNWQNSCQNVELSPNCNQVTSTSDVSKNHPGTRTEYDLTDTNLNAISTDNLIDDLSSISMENMSGHLISPTQLINRSASQTSYVDGKMTSQSNISYMDSNNMVVNDMGSLLTQLAEENKLLNGGN